MCHDVTQHGIQSEYLEKSFPCTSSLPHSSSKGSEASACSLGQTGVFCHCLQCDPRSVCHRRVVETQTEPGNPGFTS